MRCRHPKNKNRLENESCRPVDCPRVINNPLRDGGYWLGNAGVCCYKREELKPNNT